MEKEMGREKQREMKGGAELGTQVIEDVEVTSLLVRSLSPIL